MGTAGTLIKISEPSTTDLEKKYVMRALDENEISGEGKYVRIFEEKFAEYIGVKHAIAVCSGWAALFLACYTLLRGKKVVLPDITMIATANAAKQAGADVILSDVDAHGLLNSTDDSVAAMPVHLYGLPHPSNHGNIIIEDCAEAVGAFVNGRKVGSLGTVGCFSFYANKIISTGEGGMITTNNDQLAREIRKLRCHYFGDNDKYFHPEMGFNLPMTSLQAAYGLAQLERIDELIDTRTRIVQAYSKNLGGYVRLPKMEIGRVFWMYVIHTELRDSLQRYLKDCNIETRKYFRPLHTQPQFLASGKFPQATKLAETGLLLPMSEQHVDFVSDKIIEFLSRNKN